MPFVVNKYIRDTGLYSTPEKAGEVAYPMGCCGLLEAHGFDSFQAFEHDAEGIPINWNKAWGAIKEAQKESHRNCALITLSAAQVGAKADAEANGFKVIFEFFNPNSRRICYIMAKTLFADKEAFITAFKAAGSTSETWARA